MIHALGKPCGLSISKADTLVSKSNEVFGFSVDGEEKVVSEDLVLELVQ